MNQEIRPCVFCDPSVVDRPHFREFGTERIDTIPILRTDQVSVFPDILPAEPEGNHVLIVPQVHGYAAAVLPRPIREQIGEAARSFSQAIDSGVVFFEHGCTGEGIFEHSIAHQHIHAIGTDRSIIPYMEEILKRMGIVYQRVHTPDPSPAENAHRLHQNQPYLFIQQGTDGLFINDQDYTLPSQIAQSSMSKYLSGGVLNWKMLPFSYDLQRLSVKRISKVVDRFQL